MAIGISWHFEVTDMNTPENPEAKRGDFSPTHLAETGDQLKGGLVWDSCPFCGGYVLILALPPDRSREKCKCGAKRISRYIWRNGEAVNYEDGWRKNGEEWVM